MAFFEAEGKRYHPFGQGSGAEARASPSPQPRSPPLTLSFLFLSRRPQGRAGLRTSNQPAPAPAPSNRRCANSSVSRTSSRCPSRRSSPPPATRGARTSSLTRRGSRRAPEPSHPAFWGASKPPPSSGGGRLRLSARSNPARPSLSRAARQAKAFGEIAARVVQEVAKLKRAAAVQAAYNAVRARSPPPPPCAGRGRRKRVSTPAELPPRRCLAAGEEAHHGDLPGRPPHRARPGVRPPERPVRQGARRPGYGDLFRSLTWAGRRWFGLVSGLCPRFGSAPGPADVRCAPRPHLAPASNPRRQSVDEWTGIRLSRDSDVPESIEPVDLQLLGNYAVQISWPDGFNQARVAPALRARLRRLRIVVFSAALTGGGNSLSEAARCRRRWRRWTSLSLCSRPRGRTARRGDDSQQQQPKGSAKWMMASAEPELPRRQCGQTAISCKQTTSVLEHRRRAYNNSIYSASNRNKTKTRPGLRCWWATTALPPSCRSICTSLTAGGLPTPPTPLTTASVVRRGAPDGAQREPPVAEAQPSLELPPLLGAGSRRPAARRPTERLRREADGHPCCRRQPVKRRNGAA